MESFDMDATVVTFVSTVALGLGGATAAAIRWVAARITTKTDEQIDGLTHKLEKCEERHVECEVKSAIIAKRIAFIEGHLIGSGVEIPQQEG